jgi:hypothetical protein
MTPADKFIQLLAGILPSLSIWWLIKGLFVIGIGLYVAFAVIVIRQVDLMAKTLKGDFVSFLKLFSWVHLLVAVFTFLLVLVIL